ncbi:putative F-box/kelch-repeat protein At1g13200 [Primulina eburnea]|uniref:putative F-box/kelch-repeat protein At1g13200 n=1 Tax=Primulina eburnea TaxID=1245227 RepID=UPI003C6CB23D
MADADDPSEATTEVSVNPYTSRCIPQELLFDIFSRLPAQVLHDVVRYVCKEWNLVIRSPSFASHHLRNSTPGIMIQDWRSVHNAIYVEMRRGCLEICKFDSGFGHLVFNSCDGLVLAPDPRDKHILYVVNPLTKQRIILPPYFCETGHLAEFGLAFVEASMEYKVVHAYCNESFNQCTQIAVLTIGVDKVWRHIDVQHLSRATRGPLMSLPWVTGGYIHWVSETFTFLLTLNVETETIRRFPLPEIPKICGKFLPMGSNLSFANEAKESFMDVWEMNSETGEWSISLSFDLKPLIYRFEDLFGEYANAIIPSGWLVVREVLVFSTIGLQTRCMTYNVKTREIQSFELDTNKVSRFFRPHVNSLVRLEEDFLVAPTTK